MRRYRAHCEIPLLGSLYDQMWPYFCCKEPQAQTTFKIKHFQSARFDERWGPASLWTKAALEAKTSLFSLYHFIAGHHLICMEYPWGQSGSAVLALSPPHILLTPQPAGWEGQFGEKALTLCKHPSAAAKMLVCYQHCLATNEKHSTTWAVMRKVNSIMAESSTVTQRKRWPTETHFFKKYMTGRKHIMWQNTKKIESTYIC